MRLLVKAWRALHAYWHFELTPYTRMRGAVLVVNPMHASKHGEWILFDRRVVVPKHTYNIAIEEACRPWVHNTRLEAAREAWRAA